MDGLYEEENCSLTLFSLRGRGEGREKGRCTIILIHIAEPSLAERLEPASLLI